MGKAVKGKMHMRVFSKLGDRIREIREKAGLTQAELAKGAGSSQSNIARIEGGQPVTLDLGLRITSALGVDFASLLPESEGERDQDRGQTSGLGGKCIRVIGSASAGPDGTIDWEEIENRDIKLDSAEAIQVIGDSMASVAWPGQHILVIPDAELKDRDLAVVVVRRKGIFFKRIFFHEGGMVELQSDDRSNPHPSIFIRQKDIIRQYRVKGVIYE